MLKKCQTAIILAGGKSTRMGFDKINIPFQGGRLLDYQFNIFKQYFKEIILVSNQHKEFSDPFIKVVSDEYKGIGPIAGLHVGLKHASSLYSYVIACDMPNINQEFIIEMDELLININKEVLVSKINGFFEPFNAIYHKSLYKRVEENLSRHNKFGLKDLIIQSDYQIIDEELVQIFGAEMFINLNTIEDIKNMDKK